MSSILHISDTHFGTEVPAVERALEALNRTLNPELVVLSGDVTQRARRSQFQKAQQFLSRLDCRASLVLPGNHDIPLFNLPARVINPYRNYRLAFGDDLEPRVECADLEVIGVNTSRPGRFQNGEISEAQIERVCERLRRGASHKLRVVVTHQPVHIVATTDQKNLVHNSQRAVLAWAHAGADLFLGGHIHLPFVRPLRERYPGLPRNCWVVQAGTAVSSRVRGAVPNSVNVIRYQRVDATSARQPSCSIEQWDFDVASAGFFRYSHTDVDLEPRQRASSD